jgi:hypothetical protein
MSEGNSSGAHRNGKHVDTDAQARADAAIERVRQQRRLGLIDFNPSKPEDSLIECHSETQALRDSPFRREMEHDFPSKACVPESLSDTSLRQSKECEIPEFLLNGWAMVKDKPLPKIAYRYWMPQMQQLVLLCREMQIAVGDRSFFLACRHAAAIIGVHFRVASRWLAKLEYDGVVKCTERGLVGKRPHGKANEYRYLGD